MPDAWYFLLLLNEKPLRASSSSSSSCCSVIAAHGNPPVAAAGSRMEALSECFWRQEFWLPPGIRWEDLEALDSRRPLPRDLLLSLPLALGFIALRYAFERAVALPLARVLGVRDRVCVRASAVPSLEAFYTNNSRQPTEAELRTLVKQSLLSPRQVEIWFRQRRNQDRPSTSKKFCEASWRFVFYLLAFCLGLASLIKASWFWDQRECWSGFPLQPLQEEHYWYYMLELGFYWSLLLRVSVDVKRKVSPHTSISSFLPPGKTSSLSFLHPLSSRSLPLPLSLTLSPSLSFPLSHSLSLPPSLSLSLSLRQTPSAARVFSEQFLCVFQDFKEQIVHHFATIFLLGFSYCANYIRIGVLVMLLHDASDVLLEVQKCSPGSLPVVLSIRLWDAVPHHFCRVCSQSAKMLHYAGWKKVCDSLFVVFAAVFLLTRLIVFPSKYEPQEPLKHLCSTQTHRNEGSSPTFSTPCRIIYTTLILSMEVFEPFVGYYFFNALLLVLQTLHLYWAALILRMLYKFLFLGKLDKDERSDIDTEPEEEEDEEQDVANQTSWRKRKVVLDSRLAMLSSSCVLNNLTNQTAENKRRANKAR
ncbi:hypothetical protein DNTS_032689 [Danionella cerebrum]|uniref:Homeobox domain-containing protein n=1 Tax=Danionella cerebrum TaxID=2873325 RepID=A0A553MPY6_9TELE|nr:hypothetical protein DNTS_032689 [Danionella translucida]